MRRGADVLRGLLAAAALLAVLVGLPALLVTAVGWPLPRGLPQLSGLADTFTGDQPLETATVWKVLAIALWVAWAQVAVAVAVETAAVLRGGLPRPLPGLGLAHGLAAPLVAAIVLAWPTGAAPRAVAQPVPVVATADPPGSAATATPPGPAAPDVASTAAAAPAPGGVDYVVQRRDTLWDLAERYLGDGYRATELFEVNRGRPQPDGRSLSDPGLLRPGWVLRIPLPPSAAPRPGEITVAPGDTLWDLAEDHLGDGHRYHEIVDLNAGEPQSDGRALLAPDLIEPGWVLDLPPATPVTPRPDVDPSTEPAPPPSPPPQDAGTATTTPVPSTTLAPQPAPAAPSAPPGANPAPPEPPLPPDQRPDAHGDGDDAAVPVAPVGLIGGGLATAGLLGLLVRRRRAQHRRRRFGHRVAPPGPPAAAAEVALRAGADVDAAALTDAALRAAATGNGPLGLPRLRWAEATTDTVTLIVDSDARAPAGFIDAGPNRWQTTASLAELVALGESASSPAPTLVPVGTTDNGTEVLIDLEAGGVTTVDGDPDATDALLRALAVTAATAPWSEQGRVLLVGIDASSLPVPAIQVAGDLDHALDELERRADAVTGALASVRCATTAQARAAGTTPDAWEPLVVIAGTPPHELQHRRLEALVDRAAHGIAAVVRASPSADPVGTMLTLDADGNLRISDVDLTVRARQLDAAELRVVGDLLAHTDTAAVPAERIDHTPPRTPPTRAPTQSGTAIDGLLAEVDVVVRVLGEVQAFRRAPAGEQPVTIPKQKSLEAIAYLALREAPVDREDLQAALWPAGANSAKTFHNTIWAARKSLGADRDGAELFPDPVEGRYALSARAVTDYGMFHELVARADELDDAEAAATLLAEALTLVHGEPFLGVGRGYAWVAPHAGIIVSQVIDAAEELAEVRLAAGDWRGAEWAARQGLHVFPCEERLYRLLMRCAHAAGSIPGVHRAFQELVAELADPDDGVEPEDTVHPDTVALLEQLTGSTARSRRASA